MTTVTYSRERLAAVLDLLTASETPLSARQVCDALVLMPSQVSVIMGDLRKAGQIRLAGLGECNGGRRPRLFDTRVELGDADITPQPPAKTAPAFARVLAWLEQQPADRRLSVRDVAAGTGFTFDWTTRLMRHLLAAGSVRVVDRLRSDHGLPVPIYDRQTWLPSVGELLPRTREQWKAANPVRVAVYQEREAERKRIKRADTRAPTQSRPAFDPKTAIDWKRAA